MSYLAFLIVLIFAGVMFGLIRLFGGKASFEVVFKALATGVVMLPIAVWSFVFCGGIAFAMILMAAAIIDAVGLLPAVESWPVWGWFPRWLWITFGAFTVFGAGQFYYWVKEKRRII